mmetsp:Transcript_93495/g.227147  ORF Transcript_93495/g.227147 Transcript_93495/m.227147 type:complete len:222 (-) Transcript_93495:525-1190(-)
MSDISTAPGSPGLQGVQYCRGTPSGPGCCKRLNVLARLQRRTGSKMASRTRMDMSAPLNISARWAMACMSLAVRSFGVLPKCSLSMVILASASGNGIYIRFSNRRRMAVSRSQGVLVAPRMRSLPESFPTPSIWARNSVLMRRAASDSPDSPRAPQRESTSSMKMIEGLFSRAISNKLLTSRSLSPIHLETRSDEEMLKNVASASVAQAFARYDFPVPGGP